MKMQGKKSQKRCSYSNKPCGGICIPKNKKCNIRTNARAYGKELAIGYAPDEKALKYQDNYGKLTRRDKKYRKGFVDESTADSTPERNRQLYNNIRKNKRRKMNAERYRDAFFGTSKPKNNKKKHKRYKNKSNYK